MFGYPKKIILLQSQLLIFGGVTLLLGADFALAREFIFGGLVAIVPQAMFFLVFVNSPDAQSTVPSYSRIFFAESMKLMFSGLGFIAVFRVAGPANAVLVFSGFLTVYIVQAGSIFFLGQSVFRSGRLEG